MIILSNRPKRWAIVAALLVCGLLSGACVLTDAALGTTQPSPAPIQTNTQPPTHTPTPPTPAALELPAPAQAESGACVVIDTGGVVLNVRSGPGMGYSVLYALLPGESVALGAINPGAAWYPLASGGFLFSEYCEVIK